MEFQRTSRRTIRAIAARILAEARLRSIACRFVTTKDIQHVIGRSGATTKYAIATVLIERFPDIAWKLPPKRRPWESEHYNAAIFDAAAAAVAFLGDNE